jgi:CheY-like chemotaxis protein
MEYFSPGKYSIVLVDVEAPAMHSDETARHIRSFEKAEDALPVPIIAMTARVAKGAPVNLPEGGMNDRITNPFNPHQLQAMLRKHIRPCPTNHAA